VTGDVAAVLYGAAALVSTVTAALAWRERRASVAARGLLLVLAGVVEWSLADLARQVGGPDAAAVAGLATYPGVEAVVAGFFVVALSSADPGWTPTRRSGLLLAVEPALFLTLAATNAWHHLVHVPGATAGTWTLGPGYWVHTVYSYLLLTASVVLLLRAWLFAPRVHRRQLTGLLAAAAAPVLLNAVTLLGAVGDRSADLTPIAFTVTGAVGVHAITRRGLLRIVPVAREVVLDGIGDAVVVIAADGRIADLNPAADRLMRLRDPGLPADLVGIAAARVLGRDMTSQGLRSGEYQIGTTQGRVDLDLRVTPLPARGGREGGWIIVARDVTELSRRGRELAEANVRLREQVATIEQLRAELAEQAARDPLTGLHNRRHLGDRLPELIAAVGPGRPLSVVLLDVDHFKQVNDVHGHPVGDALLRAVARVLAGFAPGGVVSRHGGEEFVLALPGHDAAAAVAVAESVRAACRAVSVPGRNGVRVSCTVSAGVATYPAQAADGDALLGAADDALYAAKERGRDRTVRADEVRRTPRIPTQREP
jgi:diguanylate cyclase (GGDEF)-like protein